MDLLNSLFTKVKQDGFNTEGIFRKSANERNVNQFFENDKDKLINEVANVNVILAAVIIKKLILNVPAEMVISLNGIGVKPAVKTIQKSQLS